MIGMMEAGCSARHVARQLGRFDCVVCEEVLEPVDPRDIIYTKTKLRTPSTDQSSRRPSHRKKCTRTANCFITRHPDTGSTFNKGHCVFLNHKKVPGRRTFGITVPIMRAALGVHPSKPPFRVVLRTRNLV
ncbi:uncharacterized protein TNCV_4002181 [Trichonephila clavipes]|uniref:Uncharacterized protein n=1 Tax=Trichonephila clavipes TaxID=2585209 RepID=A0A8X6RTE3_TRICX|nr:uncharacterized protein TNCV_4002181 [Trichonephila clavipes]